LIIVLKPEVLFADLPFSVANIFDVSGLKKKYRFDITVATQNGLTHRKMLEFFQNIRDNQELKKGIVRLKI
jgi:GTP cyclohydrolase III